MRQLNTGNRPLRVNEAGDAGQRFDVLIAPDAHVDRRNTPVAGDGGGLDHDQCRSAYGTAAKVNQVPVAGQPLLRDVLAHGRHHDPIAERDAADRQRTEQIDFRDFPVVVGVSRAAVGSGRARTVHWFDWPVIHSSGDLLRDGKPTNYSGRKGTGTICAQQPSGPFRQMAPVPFSLNFSLDETPVVRALHPTKPRWPRQVWLSRPGTGRAEAGASGAGCSG